MSENEQNPFPELTKKQWFFVVYGAIAFLFWIWNSFLGSENYRGIAYNFGKSLAWPFQLFPAVGEFIGGVLIFIGIVVFVILDPKKDPRRDYED